MSLTRSPAHPFTPQRARSGLTLVELLIAMAIVTTTVGALGVMGRAVQIAAEHNESYGTATHHARVTLDRIARTVQGAHGNATYAGVWAVDEVIGSYNFPDTLVVWKPTITAANPTGAPLVRELVLFCPDPTVPGRLVEITIPGDNRSLPSPAATTTFRNFVQALRIAAGAQKTVLTDLLRVASASSTVNSSTQLRGCVRFTVEVNPPDAEWATYIAGTLPWNDLSWPQNIYGPNVGMRHVWVRSEIQLVPSGEWHATDESAKEAVPYFGSAAVCYEVVK